VGTWMILFGKLIVRVQKMIQNPVAGIKIKVLKLIIRFCVVRLVLVLLDVSRILVLEKIVFGKLQ
jgi:hypothetical protein